MALTAGQAILDGKYHILKLIGEGGMARVWLAEEPEFGGRRVAIKEPKHEQLSPAELEEQERRFRREVEMAAQLDQANAPHVIRGLTLERLSDGTRLLVMQYAEGGSLAEKIAEHPRGMPIGQALAITAQVCDALQALHGLPGKPVHRDVKPSNILFDRHGEAHLADFGLTQTRESGRTQLTGGSHPGTPGYKCPEQEKSGGYLTPGCDLYALGCVLFEMLTGKLYRDCPPGTRAAALRPEVPEWLDRVLAKALAEDPWDRYQEAAALSADLSRKPSPRETKPLPQTAAAPRPARRSPLLPAIGLVVAVIVVGAGAVLGMRACGGPGVSAGPTPTPGAVAAATKPPGASPTVVTRTPLPTDTAAARLTEAQKPQATPTAQPTLRATVSALPSATPRPTVTPALPTFTPLPILRLPESHHPYADNAEESWFVNNDSGLNACRIHFARIELEDGVDKIEIRDATDVSIQEITTSAPEGLWTDPVPGGGIYIVLQSDGSGHFWGFRVDQVEGVDYPTLAYSPHPYPNDLDRVVILVNDSPNPEGTLVHFNRVELEDGVDRIIVLDVNDIPYQWITGSHPQGFTTKAVPGAAIKIQLVSDGSVQAWGYSIDKVQSATPDEPDAEPARVSTLAESDHPYEAGVDQTWTLTNPDTEALSSKVHCSRIDMGAGDYIHILDANGTVIQRIGWDAHLKDWWSDCVPGRVVRIRLLTNAPPYYDADWGFKIDDIVRSVPHPALAESDHYYEAEVDRTWTLVNPDVAASCSKIHFPRIDLSGGDYIELSDSNDKLVQGISDNSHLKDWWSDCVPGRVVRLRFVTNRPPYYDADWGFRVDRISGLSIQ